MRTRQPKPWIIVVGFCIALGYGALHFTPRDLALSDAPVQPKQTLPETYILGMIDRSFDDDGRLSYTLEAEQVTYFEQGQGTDGTLTKPKVLFLSEKTTPWNLEADKGHVYSGNNTVILNDNVVAYSRSDDHGELTLLTETLNIDTDKQYAHTDKPVTMRSARSNTQAVGLKADLQEGRMELLSEVRGRYEP
ncbi:LPS export ABC transporter periplasmic protein LptC [Gilvimarinus xylanilyticus]|uniref:Lipopolysaccharide export system protein LptC n=1 Tax=Gilvimarinus xylanilyticus TaxID=2944139 RepID=A0A9X2I570_9GAMM|nr:LPS export ABC transporter periplasmic protein LptC [Gilvimarinus xylanilyticus]MCP8900186.1 LPS export ABC transporter periplasmic protein LptC [Gilvimarinus xylanilyticus]